MSSAAIVSQPFLDGWLFDGERNERHRVTSDANGVPSALCGYKLASGWVHDETRAPTLTCVKCKRAEKQRPLSHAEVQTLLDVSHALAQLVPLDATLAEQKLVVRRFREVMAKMPKQCTPPVDPLAAFEAIVDEDFVEPITFEDIRGAIEEVRGGK